MTAPAGGLKPRRLDLVMQLLTVVAVVGGVVAAVSWHWWWLMVGLAVAAWAVSLAPSTAAGRRSAADAVAQGVALSVIPLGVAAAVEWSWLWSIAAFGVLVAAGIVANYAEKRPR